MAQNERKPKVLLFDIGGVCVVSPMRGIIEYEKANNIPIGYVNYAISASKPNGSWHRAEKGELQLDDAWFEAFHKDLTRASTWEKFHADQLRRKQSKLSSTASTSTDSSNSNQVNKTLPPIPKINASELFWTMMSTARTPDPYMTPALIKLKATPTIHIAALSNTTIFPAGHAFNTPSPDDVRNHFEVFISSAHVGMRKPDRNIYEYAMKTIRTKWPEDDIQPGDVMFLDDIGENLRMGREMGWRTLKVILGRTNEAVRELERVTGLSLLENDGKKENMSKL